jgi:8-oxo-dGTP pyrophosphatase MutT (NUDIX family)
MSLLEPGTSPFDRDGAGNGGRAPRPRDAATLILVRREAGRPEVLMGQRSKGHVFMPHKWVFPGGRVDLSDARAPAASELAADVEDLLRFDCTRKRPRAFALAAVRETFEEAGLIVGRRSRARAPAPKGWKEYAAHGAAPELAKFQFIARAITPPGRSRRFDARFFMAEAQDVLLDDRPAVVSEELLHTRWFDLDEAASLDLPTITRTVIGEIKQRLAGERPRPPYFRFTRGGFKSDRL